MACIHGLTSFLRLKQTESIALLGLSIVNNLGTQVTEVLKTFPVLGKQVILLDPPLHILGICYLLKKSFLLLSLSQCV